MQTPYDWQEAIAHRADFIEERLSQGTPAIAVSIDVGILFYTYKRQARKLFEIYDHLAMAGIGQQSDVEAIRMAALDFAHQEGFQRSEQDVTIARVVNAISTPIKRSFADFSSAPVVARALFAEVGPAPALDKYLMLDYDGDFHARTGFGFVASTQEMADALDKRLEAAHLATAPLETALKELDSIWREAVEQDPRVLVNPLQDDISKEVAILERTEAQESKFRYLER